MNEKIAEILKRHPEGGEKFFDALDLMIRSDQDILKSYIDWVFRQLVLTENICCVVTGSFGRVLVSLYGDTLYKKFRQVIIVNGGIRSGNPVELPINNLSQLYSKKIILLDDSYYSGKTCREIEKKLQKLDYTITFNDIYVIYDGSKEKSDKVKSMFRYYGD